MVATTERTGTERRVQVAERAGAEPANDETKGGRKRKGSVKPLQLVHFFHCSSVDRSGGSESLHFAHPHTPVKGSKDSLSWVKSIGPSRRSCVPLFVLSHGRFSTLPSVSTLRGRRECSPRNHRPSPCTSELLRPLFELVNLPPQLPIPLFPNLLARLLISKEMQQLEGVGEGQERVGIFEHGFGPETGREGAVGG